MKSRIELLQELVDDYTEEIDHMISTGEHLTALDYFQSLEDRRTETKVELWKERRITGN